MATKTEAVLDLAPLFRKAFALAEQGRSHVEPNPLVGALVLQNGQIVGKGYHRFYGGHHAEIEALQDAKGKGDTLLVTLEPCSTHGKTPPCVWAIVQSKIRKIIVGASDPYPQHRGVGLQVLKQSDREVIEVDFQKEWEQQNRSFLRFLKLKRPWVIAKWAMTLDGKIASTSGDSKWVSSPNSREEVWKLRGTCEAIATGVGTVLADDPLLTAREHLKLKSPAVRVIFDSELRTPPKFQVVQNKDTKTIFVASMKLANRTSQKKLAEAGCEVIRVDEVDGKLSVTQALEELRARGVKRLLLEAGSQLNASFFKEGCVDQVTAYIAPKILGGEKALSPIAGEGIPALKDAVSIRDWSCEMVGPDLRINGFVD